MPLEKAAFKKWLCEKRPGTDFPGLSLSFYENGVAALSAGEHCPQGCNLPAQGRDIPGEQEALYAYGLRAPDVCRHIVYEEALLGGEPELLQRKMIYLRRGFDTAVKRRDDTAVKQGAARHTGPIGRLPQAGVGEQVQPQPGIFAVLQKIGHTGYGQNRLVPVENQVVGDGVEPFRQPGQNLAFQPGLVQLAPIQLGPQGRVEDFSPQQIPVLGVVDLVPVQECLGFVAKQDIAHVTQECRKHSWFVSFLARGYGMGEGNRENSVHLVYRTFEKRERFF